MAAGSPESSADFLALVGACGVLSPERLKVLPAPDTLPPDAPGAASVLVERGFLTAFQAKQLLAGRFKGFCVGPYTILDLLGRGGMGSVYLAEHGDLRRKVAIKALLTKKCPDQDLARQRSLNEARAVAALDHPNIVRIYDVEWYDDAPHLVMEFVDGESLLQALTRDGPLGFAVAAECIAQAAAGLQHAHERGFVHRDIKPGNLMRDRSGLVKVLDMGLARSLTDPEAAQADGGKVFGTVDYVAPEQAINRPDADHRVDIYSLGTTLHVLIAGKPPFEGNAAQKLMKHQNQAPPRLSELNPEVPQELSAVVAKMLAKKPADRYQSAAEVIEALAPWVVDSAHVLAGVSRTGLGTGDSRTAFRERLIGSSRRLAELPPAAAVPPTAPIEPNVLTQVFSSFETIADNPTAEPTVRVRPRPARAGNRELIFVAIGAAVLLVLGSGAWFLSGSRKAPPPPSADAPNVAPQPVNVRPKGQQKSEELVRLASDFAGLKSFVIRSGGPNPNQKGSRVISRSGSGDVPTGWSAKCSNKDTEMEAFAESVEGRSVLGIRNAQGPASAALYAPRVECPSGFVRVRIEYAANVRERALVIRFKPSDQRPAWDAMQPAVGSNWRTEDRLVDLKGASAGHFEFHNTDEAPTAAVRFRSISVIEPNPVSADRGVFDLDASALPEFRNVKTGQTKSSGEDDPKVPGASFGGAKADTESEWTCALVGGEKVLGFTTLNDAGSAQIGIELEPAVGAGTKFAPGQMFRLRVTYRTSGKGRGAVTFQNADDHKVLDRAALPNSNGEWKTVEVVTARKTAPLRGVITSAEKGAGNTLFVRSATVAAVGPPRR